MADGVQLRVLGGCELVLSELCYGRVGGASSEHMSLVQDSLARAGFEDAWLRVGFWVLFLVVTKDTVPEGSLYASLRVGIADRVNDTLMNRFQNITTLHF